MSTDLLPAPTEAAPQVAEPTEPQAATPTTLEQQDRIGVQFAWEGLLLIAIALTIAGSLLFPYGLPLPLLELAEPNAGLAALTPFLLLAMALGISLRVGEVNLAAGFLAFAAPVLFSVVRDNGMALPTAYLLTAGVAAGVGVIVAALVTVMRVPGWAAGLGVGVAVFALLDTETARGASQNLELTVSPGGNWAIVAGVAVLSVLGGLFGVLRPLRRAAFQCRAGVGYRGASGVVLTWCAMIGSCLLAGAAGILSLLPGGGFVTDPTSLSALTPLVMSLGIVLLGGTATRGGRGGVFGTLLAAVVVLMAASWLSNIDNAAVLQYWLPLGALVAGLLVNCVLEIVNRPRSIVPQAGAVAPLAEVAAEPAEHQGIPAPDVVVPAAAIAAEPVDSTLDELMGGSDEPQLSHEELPADISVSAAKADAAETARDEEAADLPVAAAAEAAESESAVESTESEENPSQPEADTVSSDEQESSTSDASAVDADESDATESETAVVDTVESPEFTGGADPEPVAAEGDGSPAEAEEAAEGDGSPAEAEETPQREPADTTTTAEIPKIVDPERDAIDSPSGDSSPYLYRPPAG